MEHEMENLRQAAAEALADRAEKWMGDEGDDVIARGMIGSIRIMVDTLSNPVVRDASEVMKLIVLTHMVSMLKTLHYLDRVSVED